MCHLLRGAAIRLYYPNIPAAAVLSRGSNAIHSPSEDHRGVPHFGLAILVI